MLTAVALLTSVSVLAGSAGDRVARGASTAAVVPVVPARLLETRPGEVTVDGRAEGGGPIPAGSVRELKVAGRANVPLDADAVLLNVAAVFPSAPGYLTIFPCGETRPDPASNVNYFPGGVYPNAVLAKIGSGGKVCIYTLAATDVIADVNGFVPAGGGLTPLNPSRIAETRSGPDERTVDRLFEGDGPIAAGTVYEIEVAGRGKVPSDAAAALLNVTSVFPEAPGYLTVWPCGEPRPDPASNVNYFPGGVYPNAVLTKIGAKGRVCVFSLATSHVVVDVAGFASPDADVTTVAPLRVLETRPGEKTFDRIGQGGGPLGAGEVIEIPLAGRGPVTADTTAVFMNLTAVFPEAPGFLTAYPCDEQRPDPASNVNYFPGGVFPNAVLAKLSGDGRVCVYSSARTHVIADFVGAVGGATDPLSYVTISDDPVQPFDRIPIRGLHQAPSLAKFSIVMDLPGGDELALPVLADAAGRYVIAPLDPEHPGSAGSIRLRPVLAGVRGFPVDVPILPLPSGSGAWNQIVTILLARVDADLADAGLTRQQLRALEINDVPGDLMTAYMLLRLLDDGTAGDIGSLLTGTLFDLTPSERALVEAIIAKLGLVELASDLHGSAASAAGFASTSVSDTVTAAAPGRVGSGAFVESLVASTVESSRCRTKNLVIDTPSELAEYMEAGVDGMVLAKGAERQVLDDIASITSLGSKLPGTIGAIVGAIGTVFATIELSEYIDSITLPTELVSLTPTGDKPVFNEDFTEPGTITGLTIVGKSTGGDVAQWVDQIISSVFSAVVGKAIGDGLSSSEWADIEQHIAGQVLGAIADTAFGAQLNALGGLMDPFCPEQWSVAIVPSAETASKYVTAKSVLGRSTVDLAALSYEPTKIGTDQIRFEARSDVFSRRSVLGYLPLETKPIIIDVTPDEVVLDNSLQSFSLTATVKNADNPEIEWTTPVDSFTSSPGAVSFNYDAPKYSHLVVAESTSTTGLRSLPGAPRRNDDATIRLNAIRIVPADQELSAGETQQMTVLDVKDQVIDSSRVTWDATGGDISATGLYRAGSKPGVYEITATLKADPSKTARTTVTIAEDACLFGTWELQVQRYLDDQIAAAGPGGAESASHVSGHEWITFTPMVTGDFYPRYSIDVDLTTSFTYPGEEGPTTFTSDRRGTGSGEFDVVNDGTELSYIPDTSDYEERVTITDPSGTFVGPWQPGGPISQAGSLFGHLFSCSSTELVMEPDGFYSNLPTYWNRTG